MAGNGLHAQVLPAPGARLNYTQVMFEYPAAGASAYVLQIADSADTSFAAPLFTRYDSSTATLVSGLQFGKKYAWRYAGITGGVQAGWNGPWHFETVASPAWSQYRVNVVINDSTANQGGLIAIDGLQAIIDRNGQPVWLAPRADDPKKKMPEMRDLTLTPFGTVTYLAGTSAGEYNLHDSLLWAPPAPPDVFSYNSYSDFYHHDFKRMDSSRYMILGSEFHFLNIPPGYDVKAYLAKPHFSQTDTTLPDGSRWIHTNGGFSLRVQHGDTTVLVNFETILEYDKNDSLLWQWKSYDHLDSNDWLVNGLDLDKQINLQGVHLNAFNMDGEGRYVYASFRNLDRVVKIEKASGNIVRTWGTNRPWLSNNEGNGFFKKQHNITLAANGRIVVFNNAGTETNGEPSSIVIFNQPAGQPSQLTWQLKCAFNPNGNNTSQRGGNADTLPNNNLLVGMGAINRIFEVTGAKKIVWAATTEKYSPMYKRWLPVPHYRVHYSSSLYPCYFTVQVKPVAAKRSGRYFVQIYNEGTAADTYTVEVPGDGLRQTVCITPGQSVEILLPQSPPGHTPQVQVTSLTNPNLVRKVQYNLN